MGARVAVPTSWRRAEPASCPKAQSLPGQAPAVAPPAPHCWQPGQALARGWGQPVPVQKEGALLGDHLIL